MKAKNLIFLAALSAGLVACSDDKQVQQCLSDQTGCVAMYKNAAVNVAGTAAVSGLPQVAAVGTTPQPGQVPDTSILPASVKVTNADIQAQAGKIEAALKAYESGNTSTINIASVSSSNPAASTSNFKPASAGISSSSSQGLEIGVTRLPEYQDEELQRQPSSYGTQSAIFSNPPEAEQYSGGEASR